MTKNGIFYLVAAIIAAAFVILIYRGHGARSGGPTGLIGSPAPSFAAQNLAGRPDALANYRGHVVLLNLWASWCPPCRAEMPDLQRLYSADKSRNLIVLGVNQGESPQRARSFAQSLGIHFPILVDDQQQYGRVYAALGLPTTIVIDPRGEVVAAFDGALTFEQMQAAVGPLLAKPS